jgi:hypothetical protein
MQMLKDQVQVWYVTFHPLIKLVEQLGGLGRWNGDWNFWKTGTKYQWSFNLPHGYYDFEEYDGVKFPTKVLGMDILFLDSTSHYL